MRAVSLLVVALLLAGPAAAQDLTREEALASAYPGAAIAAERVFLTADQQTRASARAGVAVDSALVARYVASRDGREIGRAYVDTHVVRTQRESLLVALDEAGRVLRVEVTAFLEPPEYRAPGAWLRQFQARALDDELAVDRAIRPIAGATFTSRATTAAVRRVLAIDAVLTGDAAR